MDVIFGNEPDDVGLHDARRRLLVRTMPFPPRQVSTGSWWIFERHYHVFIVDLLHPKVAVVTVQCADNQSKSDSTALSRILAVDELFPCPVELIEVSAYWAWTTTSQRCVAQTATRSRLLCCDLKVLKLQAIVQIFEMRSPIRCSICNS